MSVDVVITTYNRPTNILSLVNQLLNGVSGINCIIVVDSSEKYNETLSAMKEVQYVYSSHKNQPYQRYLGSLKSNADWILYLDDDLEILNNDFITIFMALASSDNKVVGIGSTIYFPGQKKIQYKWSHHVLLWATGEPIKVKGKLSLFGEFGGYENSEVMRTEVLSGGCMLLKRKIVLELFSDTLFSIFERRWAMGEDKYLSYRASLKGKLLLITNPVIAHPPIESTYFVNESDFQARVLYSRLWLAQVISGKRQFNVLLRFIYYAFWRIIISGGKSLLGNHEAKNKFLGNLTALNRIIKFGFDEKKITPEIVWSDEIKKDNV